MNVEMATMTSKGQLTVPAVIRKKLGLREGDKVLFIEDDVGIRILNAAALTLEGSDVVAVEGQSVHGKKT